MRVSLGKSSSRFRTFAIFHLSLTKTSIHIPSLARTDTQIPNTHGMTNGACGLPFGTGRRSRSSRQLLLTATSYPGANALIWNIVYLCLSLSRLVDHTAAMITNGWPGNHPKLHPRGLPRGNNVEGHRYEDIISTWFTIVFVALL